MPACAVVDGLEIKEIALGFPAGKANIVSLVPACAVVDSLDIEEIALGSPAGEANVVSN